MVDGVAVNPGHGRASVIVPLVCALLSGACSDDGAVAAGGDRPAGDGGGGREAGVEGGGSSPEHTKDAGDAGGSLGDDASADTAAEVTHDASMPVAEDAATGLGTATGGELLPVEAGLPEVTIPSGSVPDELAGVWQQTRASSGDYTNQFGEDFSATSGFSAQLKITPDGQYYFAHYASGTSNACAFVSQFDQSVGSAVLDGDTLTLTPAVRRVDVQNCEGSGSLYVDLDPIVLTASLAEDRQFYGGMRSFKLSLEGYSIPLELSSLFRQPTYEPVQPEQPADFSLGVDPPYQQLQGLWVAAAGTDSDFYDPNTGEFYIPELNGSSHQWLRFDGEDYEGAVALQNVNAEGVCKLDLIYYERGKATFQVLEDVGGQGTHFVGHHVFVAEESRLVANVRECDEDDGAISYELTPLTSYFRWIYFSPDNPPESFDLMCDFPLSEWQSLFCDDGSVGFIRRE